jgi:hypothetical protein
MFDFKPATIPLPSYLLNDDELEDMAARIKAVDLEADDPDRDCSRETAALAAIRTELAKRGRPISLAEK